MGLINQIANLGHHNRQPAEGNIELPTLYIGDLPKDVYDLDLYKFFEAKNFAIKKSKVIIDPKSNQSRCYGYASFRTQEEAQKAIDSLNNADFKGKKIRIMWKDKDKSNSKRIKEANVYVRGLPKEATQEHLHKLFQEFGTILSTKIETFNDGSSRGFGYVQFETEEVAKAAIEKTNDSIFMEKKIEVCIHSKKEERTDVEQKYNNLFVKGLPVDTDDTRLRELFEKFGELESVSVQKDNEGKVMDSGFVCFKESNSAKSAVEEMNKKQMDGTVLLVNRHFSKRELEIQNKSVNSEFNLA